jgi:Flp pilus assembly pilin Flp
MIFIRGLRGERGAGISGYSLMVGLVGVVALIAVSDLGDAVTGLFGDVGDRLEEAGPLGDGSGDGDTQGENEGEGEGDEEEEGSGLSLLPATAAIDQDGRPGSCETLQISAASGSPPSGPLSVSLDGDYELCGGDTCSDASLSDGQTCQLGLRGVASSNGPISGTLALSSSAGSHEVAVSGTAGSAEGQLQVFSPNPVDYGGFGNSVALSSQAIFVGAPGEYAGAVHVFSRASGTLWASLGPDDGYFEDMDGWISGDGFGTKIAVDGGRMIVGAPSADSGTGQNGGHDYGGAVYVFAVSSCSGGPGPGCGQLARLPYDPPEAFAGLGTSVAIQGNRALAGAPEGQSDGIAILYDITSCASVAAGNPGCDAIAILTNSQQTANGAFESDQFGRAVELDGNFALGGATYHADQVGFRRRGGAFVFDISSCGTVSFGSAGCVELARFLPPDNNGAGNFGYAIAGGGGRAIISAPFAPGVTANAAGIAYLYDYGSCNGSNTGSAGCSVAATLTRSSSGNLGLEVAYGGGRAFTGEPQGTAGSHGGVPVFSASASGAVSPILTLLPDVATSSSRFGDGIAVDGDTVLVGGPYDATSGTPSGAAWLIELN